jgi:transposase-like protein
MPKQVQTPVGEITVETPRDRDASFNPQFLKKPQKLKWTIRSLNGASSTPLSLSLGVTQFI